MAVLYSFDFFRTMPTLLFRDDSFAVTAAVSSSSSNVPDLSNNNNNRRSLIDSAKAEDLLLTDSLLSPQIGGPGSAFKPYASSENLFDASAFLPSRSPEMMQEMRVAQDSIRNGILEQNGSNNGKQRDYRMPIYSKVTLLFVENML